jgi:hypothetical protein
MVATSKPAMERIGKLQINANGSGLFIDTAGRKDVEDTESILRRQLPSDKQ